MARSHLVPLFRKEGGLLPFTCVRWSISQFDSKQLKFCCRLYFYTFSLPQLVREDKAPFGLEVILLFSHRSDEQRASPRPMQKPSSSYVRESDIMAQSFPPSLSAEGGGTGFAEIANLVAVHAPPPCHRKEK